MNFFEHQDQARKRTGQLVMLFGLAVLTLIVMTILLVALFLGLIQADPDQGFQWQLALQQINSENSLMVSAAVVLVVGGGSLFKLAQLKGGGRVVAEMMGGRLLRRDNATPRERVLLNVVEEMAIASGTPVPPVYAIDDSAINAFAAGFSPDDAVIGATRGIIEKLDRDELQGVMAHEFSHIVHGDMRLNIHLMGVLHGILLIGLIGYHLLDKLWWTSAGRSNNRDSKGNLGIVAFAIGLIVIGFGGVFFGNIIKSAVSRQREFLADASAVQFTRNPEGIAGALKKIGGNAAGSALGVDHAKEASHMFFGDVSHNFTALTGLFATHPPLGDRISRIEPRWDGDFITPSATKESEPDRREAAQNAKQGLDRLLDDQLLGHAVTSSLGSVALAEAALDQVGNPTQKHLAAARKTLAELPSVWVRHAHDIFGARAVVYALLFDKDSGIRQHQRQHVTNLDGIVGQCLDELLDTPLEKEEQRLTLLDMALPQLAQMGEDVRATFEECVDALIKADQKVNLFEWSIERILHHYLSHQFDSPKPPKPRHRSLKSAASSVQLLLSIIALAGTDSDQRSAAYRAGLERAQLDLPMLGAGQLSLDALNQALEQLKRLYPLAKPTLLKACIATITSDGEISSRERELIRAIADSLDCPMPPLQL